MLLAPPAAPRAAFALAFSAAPPSPRGAPGDGVDLEEWLRNQVYIPKAMVKWATNFATHPLGGAAVAAAMATVLLQLAVTDGGEAKLSRHKRYVVFPEGSTFTVAWCLTYTATTGNDIWTEGVNWAVSYDLPNETRADRYPLDQLLPAPLLQRRHRRDLYSKLEALLDAAGANGRACVLRALCETAQRFMSGGTMVDEMLRAIFTVPLARVLSWEPPEHAAYADARRAGFGRRRCEQLFAACPVSLLELALGAAAGGR